MLTLLLTSTAKADDVLRHFTKAVTTSATALESPGDSMQMMIIQNPSSNSASIFVGDSTVTTSGGTRGLEVAVGGSISMESSKHNGGTQSMHTSKVYVIAPSNQTVVVGVLKKQ